MRKRWLLEKMVRAKQLCSIHSFGFFWKKDSTGRSDSNFNIKTLDSDGKPILHLEHSVTGVLSVDGKTVTLQRCYVENWVKATWNYGRKPKESCNRVLFERC